MIATTSKPDEASEPQAEKPVAQEYFLPTEGVTVQATSVDDAIAQAKQLTVKDGDANS